MEEQVKKTISISITDLAVFTSRTGDLSAGSFNSISAIVGTRLHQKVFNDLKKEFSERISSEYTIRYLYNAGEIILKLSGRADAVLINSDDNNKIDKIIEIKSHNSSKTEFDKLLRAEHLTQLKLYGASYLLNNSVQQIELELSYVSITTTEKTSNTYIMTYDEAYDLINEVGSSYVAFAIKLLKYNESSLESIKKLTFPYGQLRSGQTEFIKQSLISLTSKEVLFVEAPTGTGKTISTLYPAIKGFLRKNYSKVFYLTAKTATRTVAHKAINDMRQKGLIIRSILLESKERICPYDKKCDAKFCPLAKGYYLKLKPAIDEILLFDDITPDLVKRIASKYEICPHEFLLDTLNYCNVVIGDYNHAFDPRVSIVRCFKDGDESQNVLLVDEAHNLVNRSREMYSASINLNCCTQAYECVMGRDSKLDKYFLQLIQYFNIANRCFEQHQCVFNFLEEVPENKTLRTEDFEATRERTRKLYQILWCVLKYLSPLLDDLEEGENRSQILEFFFDSRFWLSVYENYYDNAYITNIKITEDNTLITLDCLDASKMLNDIIKDKMSVIFFSATLSPVQYYRSILIGKDADYYKTLILPSPFPSENLDLIIDTSISTTYKNRAQTKKRLTRRIIEQLSELTGNYMIFFPSFEYLNVIHNELENAIDNKELKNARIVIQKPEMNEKEKKEFLSNFDKSSSELLIGMTVLGGHFGEGIDLVGDRLKGVIIIGVGIPTLSPEREILKNYYDEAFGDGYAFAYRFPGWEKVLQAVGRVIRTNDDTGFALLIDDRLLKPEYTVLYPEHWKI
ncbi:MAG: ATP-dependent DNA helicase [Clostridia bacterium]|nr:ATP-dependent DNA helicase [Clostridia bacterium]